MSTRLSQDAADSLAAYEQQQQAWRARAKADWARAQAPVIVGRIVFPPLTEQERMEREQQIEAGALPF